MSIPRPPAPARLVIGLFMGDKRLLPQLAAALVDRFGPADMISRWIPFGFTRYYQSEMGAPLFRRMFAFRELIDPARLPEVKHATNALEQAYMADGRRRVNIDPGYLVRERLVLATGKNFTHRIYLGSQIYADLTLIYTKGDFQTLPWTYPDYADERMLIWLRQVRNRYSHEIKQGNTSS